MHPDTDYPLAGCSPTEPASVSQTSTAPRALSSRDGHFLAVVCRAGPRKRSRDTACLRAMRTGIPLESAGMLLGTQTRMRTTRSFAGWRTFFAIRLTTAKRVPEFAASSQSAGQHAQQTKERIAVINPTVFETRFHDDIKATLGCHDRIIFRGLLPVQWDQSLNHYVDCVLGIRRKDFIPKLEGLSQQLVDHAKELAQAQGAPYEYRQGGFSKEKYIDKIDCKRGHPEGLLAVLCVQENDRTVKIRPGEGKPQLYFDKRPHRVLYFYFNDLAYGRRFVRIQTYFPYTIEVYVNGHSWLTEQMVGARMAFVQQDNALCDIGDPQAAQALADRFAELNWAGVLSAWTVGLMPLLAHDWFKGMRYDWKIKQFEYSIDVEFKHGQRLARLFPVLVSHALRSFSPDDIMGFLGRRLHPRFEGEIITDYKNKRHPGARLKHQVKQNWIKMYDKFGHILRIEMVINQPGEFEILRWGTRNGARVRDWFPMAKFVANIGRYTEIAQQVLRRYLNALAAVQDPTAAIESLEQRCRPVRSGKTKIRALKPLDADDQTLFRVVMRGEFILNGLRNRQVSEHLFPSPAQDAKERRRRSAHVGRRLRILRAHGLIKKAPRRRKYYVTENGFRIMGAAVSLKDDQFPRLIERIRALAS